MRPSLVDHTLSEEQQRDFHKIRRLGIGKYAKVYVCRRQSEGEQGKEYAMKEVRMNTACHNEYLLRERDLLILCDQSPFIVSLMCAFQDPHHQRAYLILELGEGGDLYELHEDVHLFNEPEARFYLAEIVCGLEFLHERGIIHRDVKGENVLLTGAGHVMLCDLGLARQLAGPDDRARTFCGTLSYMSPEMVRRQRYGTKTDIWSLGVLLAFLVTGEEPILGNNDDEKQSNIMKGRYHLSCIAKMSYACRSLISNMLKASPEQRPTAAELKSRRFLNKLDWALVGSSGLQPPHRPRYGRKGRRGGAGICHHGQQHPPAIVTAGAAEATAASPARRAASKSRGDSQFRFHADDDSRRSCSQQPTTASSSVGGDGADASSAEVTAAPPPPPPRIDGFDWVSPEMLQLAELRLAAEADEPAAAGTTAAAAAATKTTTTTTAMAEPAAGCDLAR